MAGLLVTACCPTPAHILHLCGTHDNTAHHCCNQEPATSPPSLHFRSTQLLALKGFSGDQPLEVGGAQATPSASLSQVDLEALTTRTQDGGTEVVQAKAGKVFPRSAHLHCPQQIATPTSALVRLLYTHFVSSADRLDV